MIWGAVCSVWGGLILAQLRARRDGVFLRPRSPAHDAQDACPTVCVVIPARNEANALEHCLKNVLAQDYTSLSVVIADDRSEDDTASVAERIARGDWRVRVVHIDELPAGWMGKSHALWIATREVDTDWLLFLDVDCTLEPHAVRTAVGEARRRDVELLTLWPRQASGGFWEHLIIPLCAAIIALWFGSRRRGAFANGQFLMMTRSAYERIGGHRVVRTALIEDVPLAERAHEGGVRSWVASGRDLLCVRMYDGYTAIIDGWARIYIGALRSSVKLLASILWLAVGSLTPYIVAAILVAARVIDKPHLDASTFNALLALCVTHLMLMMVASVRFWGMGGCKRVYLLLYPWSVLIVMRILARSAWWLIVRRRVPWRNREYTIDRRGVIVE